MMREGTKHEGDGVIARAVVLSETMRRATHRRAFQHALAEFVAIVRSVPDYPRATFSLDDTHSLTAAAQSVIDDIERRVSTQDDRAGVQVALVEAVYAIRGGLEEIDRWQRHFLAVR
jgi:hypothetical protein